MNYHWTTDARTPRQHWLYTGELGGKRAAGLVYEVQPDAYSVYGEGFAKNPFARQFLAEMPTLDEAKDLLLTVVNSRTGENV
jgi:hypothetical protein